MPSTMIDTQQHTRERVLRWLPLAGAVYGVLNLVPLLAGWVDSFPDDDASLANLASYYATHHAGVLRFGELGGIAVMFLALFAATLVVRARTVPVVAAIIAIGAAAQVAHEEWSAASYAMVARISTDHTVTPAALQAWHLGTSFGLGSALAVLLLGIALAGIVGKLVPAWIAWSALVLGIAQYLPGFAGFVALLFIEVVWFAAVGIALAVRAPAEG